MLLVSACLAGEPVRYDGRDSGHDKIRQLIQQGKAKFVCPELLGGFPIPRLPAEIINGTGLDVLNGTAKVMDCAGEDVTAQYLEGAYKALKIAQDLGASCIVLKENSPSCGSQQIYDGSFDGHKIIGMGVTTALFRQYGFNVISEYQLKDWLESHT
ncbi:DUF523 domain-containing protein [Acinetobacter puyangensis]|uniref:Uncharacterized conserved protein YbbK, DUF523 family n=1 Tax=Acinetobacter puyangensis TaxID=1096779 RepID=A0A240E7F7_9GAMM|nr:DUF523 domain-containing protein [Acinetobacter puyangensis]SNX44506.1 Uncharacterized conserved protein YbbK, DUF523 family [Acinetobacter puyangensis]